MDDIAYKLIKAGIRSIDDITDEAMKIRVQTLLDEDNVA